ncbi:tyrosine-protein phosphatase [Paraliobacillus salinarum]|uniref:tyrosine-protein phosphatase n=1 Tax=Paraliobacillus salinarum TaxID=1158996 RepID=UPI0015F5B141|nr:CpsB/CapC family capsule biosynthesis tyrosine phosphatase [Paraliobacillus salinarum]
MIDIHTHILTDSDHGARHMQDSIKIAQQAAKQGVEVIIATPNHLNGKHHNPADQVLAKVENLNAKLIEYNIPLTVLPGQNLRLHGDIVKGLERNQWLQLNRSSSYLLIDLPTNHLPNYTMQLIYDLQLKGIKPIFSDPQKNIIINERLDVLYELVKNGALIEVSAQTVIGKKGHKTRKFINKMIEYNLVHFIASGATNHKDYYLKEAMATVYRTFGKDTASQFTENATTVTRGEIIIEEEPIRPKKKTFLRMYS